MSSKYVIYMHKNKINHMVYIGQTCQNPPSKRWGKNGNGYKDNDKFFRAIQKYGWENFDHIILKTNLSATDADKYEIYYINLYKSCEKDKGYNLHSGGSHHTITEETRKKQSISHLNKPHTKEQNIKNSISNKGKHNRKHTLQEKQLISEKKKKSVICLNTNQIFNSIKEAAEWCNLKGWGNISTVCKKQRLTAGKHPITKEPLKWAFTEEEGR